MGNQQKIKQDAVIALAKDIEQLDASGIDAIRRGQCVFC